MIAVLEHLGARRTATSEAGGVRLVTLVLLILGLVLIQGGNTVRAGASGGYLSISAGGRFTCGIQTDHSVSCWGDNLYGQAEAPAGQFVQVSAGAFHACGILPSRRVVCWGFYGTKTVDAASSGFSAVSAGYEVDCGVVSSAAHLMCWNLQRGGTSTIPGHFTSAAVGADGWCSLDTLRTALCESFGNQRTMPAPTGTLDQISGSASYFCALRTDHSVTCWGNSDEGGVGSPPGGVLTQISVGRSHGCGLRVDRSAVCWGYDADGDTLAPTGVFTQVSAGDDFSCGIRENGTVLCWGNDAFGQLRVPHDLASSTVTQANSYGDLQRNLVEVGVDVHGSVRREGGFVVSSSAGRATVLTGGRLLRGVGRQQIVVVTGAGLAHAVPDAVVLSSGAHTTAMVALLSIPAGGFHAVHWGNSYRLVQQPSVFALRRSTATSTQIMFDPLHLGAVGADRHDSLGSFWLETTQNAPGLEPGDPLLAADGGLMGLTIDVRADGTAFAASSHWMQPVVAALLQRLPPG